METSDTEDLRTDINRKKNHRATLWLRRWWTEGRRCMAVQYLPLMSRGRNRESDWNRGEKGEMPVRSENTNHYNWFCASLNKNIRYILSDAIRLAGDEAFFVITLRKEMWKEICIQKKICLIKHSCSVCPKKACTWHNVLLPPSHSSLSLIILPKRSAHSTQNNKHLRSTNIPGKVGTKQSENVVIFMQMLISSLHTLLTFAKKT